MALYRLTTIRKRAKEAGLVVKSRKNSFSLIDYNGTVLVADTSLDQVESSLIGEYEAITGKKY